MTRLFLTMLIAIVFQIAYAQDRAPQHVQLEALVGRWTLQGLEDRFIEVCEMYPGGYFLVCNSEFKLKSGAVSKSVSIIGFDAQKSQITYYHYGSRGESQTLTGQVDEKGTFYYEGTSEVDGKPAKIRINMVPTNEDNYTFKEETSIDGGPWEETTDMVYVRLK